MAFFGLTALGMQDPFKVAADAVVHFPIFTDDDFHKAFDRQKSKSKDGFSITLEQLPALMEDVYRGPVPRAEYALLEKWVSQSTSGAGKIEHESIYWHQFLEAVRSARKEAEEQIKVGETVVGPACETSSWDEYSTKIRKCAVSSKAPSQKYTTPITAQQEVSVIR